MQSSPVGSSSDKSQRRIKEERFPLYKDREVGFRQNEQMMTACLTEVQRDDDVDTDEEVYD